MSTQASHGSSMSPAFTARSTDSWPADPDEGGTEEIRGRGSPRMETGARMRASAASVSGSDGITGGAACRELVLALVDTILRSLPWRLVEQAGEQHPQLACHRGHVTLVDLAAVEHAGQADRGTRQATFTQVFRNRLEVAQHAQLDIPEVGASPCGHASMVRAG